MPDRLLSFYGDDFTGSSDVMEAMASHGMPTVLFTRRPTEAEFDPFSHYRCIGLAGSSRSQSPAWMDAHLMPAFSWLKSLGAKHCHYKVCSTFDSSPLVGSIGKAIDIGRAVFAQDSVLLIVGVPELKRFTAFGHLYAGYQGQIYRIDRHPVMSRHPVTPMDEADLRLHLARQTPTPISLIGLDLLARTDRNDVIDNLLAALNGIALIDVADPSSQREAGRQLVRLTPRIGSFVVGSSGVEYALLHALVVDGAIQGKVTFAPVLPAPRVLALSGSVSPTSERQIHCALAQGFDGIAADPVALTTNRAAETARIMAAATQVLDHGRSPLIYTALGPSTDHGYELDKLAGARQTVGEALGQIARALIELHRLRRVIFAGGDTSSHALGQLDVHALTTRYPLAATPGSPLCTAHSTTPSLNGIDLAMKGGQVGADNYFVMLRDGLPTV
jgi:3-oxoisoapionate kinase